MSRTRESRCGLIQGTPKHRRAVGIYADEMHRFGDDSHGGGEFPRELVQVCCHGSMLGITSVEVGDQRTSVNEPGLQGRQLRLRISLRQFLEGRLIDNFPFVEAARWARGKSSLVSELAPFFNANRAPRL